jgi:hypothetical protein
VRLHDHAQPVGDGQVAEEPDLKRCCRAVKARAGL